MKLKETTENHTHASEVHMDWWKDLVLTNEDRQLLTDRALELAEQRLQAQVSVDSGAESETRWLQGFREEAAARPGLTYLVRLDDRELVQGLLAFSRREVVNG